MLIGQVHIGTQVHSQNFAYLCVYATTTVSAVFSFLQRYTAKLVDEDTAILMWASSEMCRQICIFFFDSLSSFFIQTFKILHSFYS